MASYTQFRPTPEWPSLAGGLRSAAGYRLIDTFDDGILVGYAEPSPIRAGEVTRKWLHRSATGEELFFSHWGPGRRLLHYRSSDRTVIGKSVLEGRYVVARDITDQSIWRCENQKRLVFYKPGLPIPFRTTPLVIWWMTHLGAG
jgi:hypothetical protein